MCLCVCASLQVRLDETGKSSEIWLDVMGKHNGHDGKLCLLIESEAPKPVFPRASTPTGLPPVFSGADSKGVDSTDHSEAPSLPPGYVMRTRKEIMWADRARGVGGMHRATGSVRCVKGNMV